MTKPHFVSKTLSSRTFPDHLAFEDQFRYVDVWLNHQWVYRAQVGKYQNSFQVKNVIENIARNFILHTKRGQEQFLTALHENF
jgi:hypothetical protein